MSNGIQTEKTFEEILTIVAGAASYLGGQGTISATVAKDITNVASVLAGIFAGFKAAAPTPTTSTTPNPTSTTPTP